MRTIAIANQKGGVGKSTTAVNLGAFLASMGRRVVIVDSDPQGNATSGLGLQKGRQVRCLYDCLIGEVPMAEVLEATAVPGLWCVPATVELAGAEVELVAVMSRESRLKASVAGLDGYDYCLIDCPPSLGLLTLNALTAADEVLVPIQCEFYALEGLGQLLSTVDLVRRHLNPSLKIGGVVMTMHDSRTNLSQQVVDEVRSHFPSEMLRTVIPRNVKLSEAPSFGQPILLYDPKSKGADAYRELAKEVMERG